MTYCVAISVDAGICFIADSRTNAGVDNVSTYSKMHIFGVDGERQIVVLSAGNLATTQGVISQLKKDIKMGAGQHLLNVPHLTDAGFGAFRARMPEPRLCHINTARFGRPDDYVFGANVAGFLKVADAMRAQGVV